MIAKTAMLAAVLIAVAGLAACGRDDNVVVSCDKPQFYQTVVRGEKVRAPEGLDDLEEFKEMPIPEATPRPQRPPGSPCIDLPPNVLGSGSN